MTLRKGVDDEVTDMERPEPKPDDRDWAGYLASKIPPEIEVKSEHFRGPFKFSPESDSVDVSLETADGVDRGLVEIRYYTRKRKFYEISHTYDKVEEIGEEKWARRCFDCWEVDSIGLPQFLRAYFIQGDLTDDLLNALRDIAR